MFDENPRKKEKKRKGDEGVERKWPAVNAMHFDVILGEMVQLLAEILWLSEWRCYFSMSTYVWWAYVWIGRRRIRLTDHTSPNASKKNERTIGFWSFIKCGLIFPCFFFLSSIPHLLCVLAHALRILWSVCSFFLFISFVVLSFFRFVLPTFTLSI